MRRKAVSVRSICPTLILLALAGCDPCAPTFGCEAQATATLVGQVVDPSNGLPLENTTITIERIGGVSVSQISATTRSANDGSFQLSLPAAASGDLLVAAAIHTPGRPRYVVDSVAIQVTHKAGDATVVRPWVGFSPEFPVVIAVRDLQDVPIPGSVVVFRRSSGIKLLAGGVLVDSVSGTTGPDGFLRLLQGISTDTTGSVIGDFVVRLPSGITRTLLSQQITALPEFHQPFGFLVLRVPR